MGNPLRDRRTPSELAASGQIIEFQCKIRDLTQLAAIVAADLATLDSGMAPYGWADAEVSGRLAFGYADAQSGLQPQGQWPALEGEVTATIDAVCQRCLEPLRLPLRAELRLLFASDTGTPTGDEEFDVWELEEDTLRPLDLVEEVLIMALPLAARHVDDAACRATDGPDEEPGEMTRPFAGLKAQMEQDD